jgi:hypothetical protein
MCSHQPIIEVIATKSLFSTGISKAWFSEINAEGLVDDCMKSSMGSRPQNVTFLRLD